jgi:hypothetical protein
MSDAIRLRHVARVAESQCHALLEYIRHQSSGPRSRTAHRRNTGHPRMHGDISHRKSYMFGSLLEISGASPLPEIFHADA